MSVPKSLAEERPKIGGKGQERLRENFRVLYELNHSNIYGFLIHKGASHDVAHELTQQVFVTAYSKLDTLINEAAFRPWLFSIARNMWMRHIADRVREPEPLDAETDRRAEEILASNSPSALEAMLDRERVRLVREAINELPDRVQECLRAWVMEGLGYREIGQRMGISASTVGVHIHRAVKHLREQLKSYAAYGGRQR